MTEGPKIIGRIFFKGTFGLDSDITVECADEKMTLEEFKSVFKQIYNSDIYWQCNARYVSAQKAAELCKAAGYDCDEAYIALCRSYGNLWNYTGD